MKEKLPGIIQFVSKSSAKLILDVAGALPRNIQTAFMGEMTRLREYGN